MLGWNISKGLYLSIEMLSKPKDFGLQTAETKQFCFFWIAQSHEPLLVDAITTALCWQQTGFSTDDCTTPSMHCILTIFIYFAR